MTPVRDIKIIEAILFASGDPVLESDLKEKVINKNQFDDYMKEIQKFYEFRGINIIKNGLKWSFRTSIDIADDLIIFKQQKRKISRAALETLAIVAYYQPVTRSEIENIRGVQMGRGSIDHLMEIGWIKPGLRKNVPGKPSLWSTTDLFLEHFGLENISSLPNKEELKASGFLDKRAAIATIGDLALNNSESIEAIEDQEAENLDDFLPIND
jgi:segregation and condensation protein B